MPLAGYQNATSPQSVSQRHLPFHVGAQGSSLNSEPLLYWWLRGKVFVDAIWLRRGRLNSFKKHHGSLQQLCEYQPCVQLKFLECLISSSHGQWLEVLYSALSTHKQHLRQEYKASPRKSSTPFVPLWFLKMLTWLQVISVALRGVVAAVTISVLLMKSLLSVPYLRRRTHTIVETWIHPEHLGWRMWISQPPWLSALLEGQQAWCFFHPSGSSWPTTKWSKLPPWDMASFYISSIGTTSGTIKRTTTGTSALKKDLRVLDLELTNVTSANFWATTRSRHECATTCARWLPRLHLLITKWPDELRCFGLPATDEANFGSIHSLCLSFIMFHQDHHVHHVRLYKMLQTLRSWRRWTHRKSTQKKTQCQGSNISQRKWTNYFSSRRWTCQSFWKRSGTENIHLGTAATQIKESNSDFLGESEGSLPPPQDSFPDAGEAINDFWSMSGNFIHHHHVEPRVKLYSPREESFSFSTEIHWRTENYKNEFGCYARTSHRWLLEHRWVKRFVWFLDRFHSVYSVGRETSKRIYVVREATDKTAVNIQARSFMARPIGRNAKLKERQKMFKWKTKTR